MKGSRRALELWSPLPPLASGIADYVAEQLATLAEHFSLTLVVEDPDEISQPLASRFGVHLIQVTERRDQQLSQREQREIVRGLLRERKSAEALSTWLQDVRGRAFVEYREAPSL